jgi:hypothetical protein
MTAKKMESKLVKITPAMAKEWLRKNDGNRSLSKVTVEKYARDMSAGCWHYNHQGIALAVDGSLVDGQHRLHAIVASGKAVEMKVDFNVPLESRLTIDIGRVRSATDILRFNGHDNAARKRSLLQKIWSFEKSTPQGISMQETLTMYEERKEEVEWVFQALGSINGKSTRAPVKAAFVYASPTNPIKIDELAKSIVLGANLEVGTAAFSLRNMFGRPTTYGFSAEIELMSKVFNAMFHHVHGTQCKVLKIGDIGYNYFRAERQRMGLPVLGKDPT